MASLYLGLALLSAAALAFEVTLTRLFSVTQWYHFAFLAVSIALLGYGASGTLLSLAPRWVQAPVYRRASRSAMLFAVCVLGAYLCLNYLPFDSYRIAVERIQILYLALYYLALTTPFFCAGLVTGLLLSVHAQRAAQIYAANLLGSALGGLLPLLILPWTGEGAVLVISALAFVAAALFRLPDIRPRTHSSRSRIPVALLLGAGLVAFIVAWNLPHPLHLRLSPYKGLSQVLNFPDARITWQRWNAFSRVDRVSSTAVRSAPGLSLTYPGQMPVQDGLFVDGDDLSGIIRTDSGFTSADLASLTGHLPVALPYRLRPGGRVLLFEPRGGIDLWTALSQGAATVQVVESNPLVIAATDGPYRLDRVQIVVEEGRSYTSRSDEFFDVIHLALFDSYRPVSSGAYSLGERYDLTVEAFAEYMGRLRPGGLLVVERWLQSPPSEFLRAGATAIKALEQLRVRDPAAHLVAIRGWQVGLLLIKNGPFTTAELSTVRRFSESQSLDLVALPGLTEEETNRFNELQEPSYFRAFQQLWTDPTAAYRAQTYDVRPTTDDRPFFFHFFKWEQTQAILQQLGRTWQPWGGSGYFVVIALLAVALLASFMLILLPLVLSRHRLRGPRGRVLVYFGLLGLGFLFIEIPLMQQFILFLGQPVYAFAAVAAAILFFSGVGSLLTPRLSTRWTMPVLVAAILAYPLVLPELIQATLGVPLSLRLLITGLSLAPLGILMGTPFPRGLAWLEQHHPNMIPWAWAINGCTSVLASVLAALLALSAGYSWVLIAAALAYAGAWLARHRLAQFSIPWYNPLR
ncbi:MAG: hypothetical protein PVH11_01985 [Anaerolineae bacterium]|jgi:hypothetical protein